MTDIDADRLSTLYTTAFHISGSRVGAEKSLVAAYQHAAAAPDPSEPDSRLRLLMRELVSTAKRTATAVSESDPVSWAGNSKNRVAILLASLDLDLRAAVVLRDIAGLSHVEAADALDTTPEKFGELLSEGRLMLVQRMM